MKPDTIHIKKGASVYDDAEEDRDLPQPPPRPARRPPARRRRPPSRSVLAPLIAVAAGIFLVFRVVPHAVANRAVVAGWQTTLHVARIEDGLVVGLTFVARGRPSAPPEATARVFLRGTSEQVFLAGDLDRSPMTLRGRLPALPAARVVQADVSIAGARVTLVAPVPPPASGS